MRSRQQTSSLSFLAGGGEMGERLRTFDWTSTSLGPPENWPQSLKTSIRIMLMSRQPVWIGWGKDLLYFYNDPYFSIIGGKHPWAFAKPTREVWHEIWDVIGPMLDTAMSGDEGTYVESQLLIMQRSGYPEETYYTFSYSPIPDDEGNPGGIFCANTDDTPRVIGQQELALLRELASRTSKSTNAGEACERSMAALATNPWDLPFAAIYLFDEEEQAAKLYGVSGIKAGHRLAPRLVPRDGGLFEVGQLLSDREPQSLTDLGDPGDLPPGAWPIPPHQAIALPLVAAGEASGGLLLVGLSPYRLVGEAYLGFLNLVAGQIAAAISDAEAIDRDRKRMESMAELDRAKTAFFANVSHEFRTPLTLMLGPLQDVLSQDLGSISSNVARELDTVRRNGVRLQKLVNALLDFSRFEAGRVHAQFQPSDVAVLTSEAASAFHSATDRAGLVLKVDCPPLASDTPAYVDSDMWEKVILNLVSNAFKHTFEGSVTVSIRDLGDSFQLEVADTGTGIPQADLPHLFERFRRVDGAKARTHEGSGIGLALVHEIVRLHGGEVSVASRTEGPDHGTTFTVNIPLGRAHLPAAQVSDESSRPINRSADAMVEEAMRWLPDAEAESADLESIEGVAHAVVRTAGARILVADDNADMRGYISRLVSRNYVVQTVSDGEAALEAIRQQLPDLLITDVMMPRMDGFELVKTIRSDPEIAHLPIIVLSARAGEESRIEGIDSGADDYLVKPFSARELVARVDSTLALCRLRRESGEALRRSEERLQMALGAARLAAWEWNPEDDSVIGSEHLSHLYGLPQGTPSLSADVYRSFQHPEDAERRRMELAKAMQTKSGYQHQFRAFHQGDGSTIWFEDRGMAVTGPNGTIRLMGVVMDVTDRKRIEQERADAEAMLAAEKRVLEAITSGQRIEDVLDLLAREAEALSRGGLFCSVLLLDETGKRLVMGAAPSLPDAYNTAVHGIAIGPSVGSCGTAAFRREPVMVEDIEHDPLWADYKDLALASGLRSCHSTPVFSSRGDLLGTMAVYYSQKKHLSPHDQELIARAAALAGIVTERDRALSAAEVERTRLHELFMRAPAIICVFRGPDHIFQLANPFYLQLVGRKDVSEILGRPLREVLPEVVEQGFVDLLDGVYATGEPFIGREVAVHLDRTGTGVLEEVMMNFVYQPSRNAQGEIEGILVHAVDISELVNSRREVEMLAQSLEDSVRHRTAELLQANEQLQGFTYSVAHDLRQQIRGISINASLVLEDAGPRLDGPSTDHLKRLIKAASQLGKLVDDLLQYAKFGKAIPSEVEINLSSLAAEVTEHLREGKECSPNTDFVIGDSPNVVGDPALLRIVLDNLLQNACKYSRNTEAPVVEFGYGDRGFYVRDNGVGFDMAYVHKLFLPFERLHSDESFGGTGIGLANVRRILEKHGGQVWAEGTPGEGATFGFKLPR